MLYGCDGGGLGTRCNTNLALRWKGDGNVMIDPKGLINGTLLPGLTFGDGSGEGIASKRTAAGNQYGLDFYVNSVARLSISQSGTVVIGGLVMTGGSVLLADEPDSRVGIDRLASANKLEVEGNASKTTSGGWRTNFTFSFHSKTGASYTVECNTDLRTTNWLSLETITGDGSPLTCSIPRTNGAQLFFRVRKP